MEATAWNNGKHHRTGAGYGLKISVADRDRYFHRTWQMVKLIVAGADNPIAVNVDKSSFWNESCRELISAELGKWMIRSKLAPWPSGRPLKFQLNPVADSIFEVRNV